MEIRIKINQMNLTLNYTNEDLNNEAAKILGCKASDILSSEVVSRTVDARSRSRIPHFAVSALVKIEEGKVKNKLPDNAGIYKEPEKKVFPSPSKDRIEKLKRPVVVGAGPSGLLCALFLSEHGLKPILIERGEAVEERSNVVKDFWYEGIFKEESNTLFGEGGAGLFSDGKLTSRSKDKARVRKVLETFVQCGADPDILIDRYPHLGSDRLKVIVPSIRQKIIENGGEVRFSSTLDGLIIENGVLKGITVNKKPLETGICILATGHSARDIYTLLYEKGVSISSKPFAVGVRLEIPQDKINFAQWGKWKDHPKLSAASFRLTRKEEKGARACYTFCMCPGGMVIPCASSKGALTTNGMSLSARDEKFANAAFLVPVNPEDFSYKDIPQTLSGLHFQHEIEKASFIAGGENYGLPASRLEDFLNGSITKKLPDSLSCEKSVPSDLRKLLPGFVTETLLSAVPKMLRTLNGVSLKDALLYAAETRSSSPVRIDRDRDLQSENVKGLFPAGEGAGYAGGIVSSAVDGLKVAESVLSIYSGS